MGASFEEGVGDGVEVVAVSGMVSKLYLNLLDRSKAPRDRRVSEAPAPVDGEDLAGDEAGTSDEEVDGLDDIKG